MMATSPLCTTPSGSLLPITPPNMSLASAASVSEALLENPPDLVCPITHELFTEPVINGAGQVYERSAIEMHLRRSSTDPVTRMQIHPASPLTPVWIVKSRASDFRESTARQCIEKACASPGQDAIKYVRRAAELCAGTNFTVQGLSRSCINYAQTHPSSAHDDVCMRLFAAGLLAAGLKDEAAAVYYSLLQGGADKGQQAELLRQCLACWTSDPNGRPDDATFRKLSRFVEQQSTFSWGRIIELVQAAGFGDAFALRLCEELILRKSGVSNDKADWAMQKEVFVKYVQICHHHMAGKQQATDERVTALSQQLVQQRHIQHSLQEEVQQQQADQKQRRPDRSGSEGSIPWHKRRKLLGAIVWGGASLLPRAHFAIRMVKVASLVYVLHERDK